MTYNYQVAEDKYALRGSVENIAYLRRFYKNIEIAREKSFHASWKDKNSLELDILHSWIRMGKIQKIDIL